MDAFLSNADASLLRKRETSGSVWGKVPLDCHMKGFHVKGVAGVCYMEENALFDHKEKKMSFQSAHHFGRCNLLIGSARV